MILRFCGTLFNLWMKLHITHRSELAAIGHANYQILPTTSSLWAGGVHQAKSVCVVKRDWWILHDIRYLLPVVSFRTQPWLNAWISLSLLELVSLISDLLLFAFLNLSNLLKPAHLHICTSWRSFFSTRTTRAGDTMFSGIGNNMFLLLNIKSKSVNQPRSLEHVEKESSEMNPLPL